ncbi:MAG: hypothetical protein V7760_03105, partial [Marinobacter sp.]
MWQISHRGIPGFTRFCHGNTFTSTIVSATKEKPHKIQTTGPPVIKRPWMLAVTPVCSTAISEFMRGNLFKLVKYHRMMMRPQMIIFSIKYKN